MRQGDFIEIKDLEDTLLFPPNNFHYQALELHKVEIKRLRKENDLFSAWLDDYELITKELEKESK